MPCNENEYEIMQVTVHHSLAKYAFVLPSRVRGNTAANIKDIVTYVLVILKIEQSLKFLDIKKLSYTYIHTYIHHT